MSSMARPTAVICAGGVRPPRWPRPTAAGYTGELGQRRGGMKAWLGCKSADDFSGRPTDRRLGSGAYSAPCLPTVPEQPSTVRRDTILGIGGRRALPRQMPGCGIAHGELRSAVIEIQVIE